MLNLHDQIEIKIDRLATGGRGVGRYEGMVVFVTDTAPDETVRAEITLVKKNYAEARLVEVITPSPHRVQPQCGVAGICGGCTWQHVSYPEQLKQKRGIVADALRKFGGRGALEVNEVIPSPNPLQYRNRIQVQYQNGQIGFHKRGTHEIVPIDQCLISDTRLNEELLRLRDQLKKENSGPVRREIYLTENSVPAISSELRFDDELGFAQVNEPQNQNLIRFVLERLGNPEIVFDLYAGAGNFALSVASARPDIPKIVAVELHPKSIQHGKTKASQMRLKQLEFVHAPVGDFLTEVVKGRRSLNKESFWNATVILDPPRAGCDADVMKRLAQFKPRDLIYVSCDPVTLARDLARLPKDVYDVLTVQPFDMFPQTDHIETALHLRRRSN